MADGLTPPERIDVLKPGQNVKILYPPYAAGQIGVLVRLETLQHAGKSGCWLVAVNDSEMILALAPSEFVVLPECQCSG